MAFNPSGMGARASDVHAFAAPATWRVLLIGWIGGTAIQLQQADLWPWPFLAAAVAVLLPLGWGLAWRERRGRLGLLALCWRLVLAAALAWCCVGLRASVMLNARMPGALEGRDLELVGVVSAMPQRSESGVRFRFEVESARDQGQQVTVPAQIYLAWYGGTASGMDGLSASPAIADLQAGERWQWRVRLKAPHGHMNPGGFDYELWLWEQGLQATGYVRTGQHDPVPVRLGQTFRHPVELARQRVRDAIVDRLTDAAEGVNPDRRKLAGVVAALVTGDQSAIDRSDWDVFRATGVAHLMSISGLHVTLFAWVAAGVIGALWRRSARWGWRWCLRWPAPQAGWLGGLALAMAYAWFSGWGVPAQRTVWMLATVGVLRWSGRLWPMPWVWTLALGVVVVWDPWALLQAGFWLSFIAVGILFASSTPDSNGPVLVHNNAHLRALMVWLHQYGWISQFWNLLREQWVVTWALTPLSVLFFGQISWVGLLANLIAIPWVTLVVTPLSMAGLLWPGCWSLAVAALRPLQALLLWLSTFPWASAYLAIPPWELALFAVCGGLVMVMPWSWRVRCLGIPLLLPVLAWQAPRPLVGHFEVLAPDVGQGNAVWVRTAHHSLLYDTGPRYSVESDAGHRVVMPLLRRWDERLDMLVLSHRDIDHTGGAEAVMATQPQLSLLSSLEPAHPLLGAPFGGKVSRRCEAGQGWEWDGVQFEVLHPQAEDYLPGARSNSLSCVLHITNGAHTALLTGDIEAAQELALLRRLESVDKGGAGLRADVLLVPHHGSKTSSTPAFIEAVSPHWAWVQAGYRNRFGHPAAQVVARYRTQGVGMLDSVHCGAMQWRTVQAATVTCERLAARRYWHHQAP